MIRTSRRNFLKVTTLAGGGLMMSISAPGLANLLGSNSIDLAEINSYLTIDTKGNIVFLLTKHEMGQGSGTGLPMILADELGADWNKLSIKRSDYDSKFTSTEMGTTGGSSTIRKMWDILRNAGATAREMLKQTAANQWNVDSSELLVENNFVINPENDARLEFGVLASAASKLEVPESVELKKPKDFVYIGKPVKNLITHDVVIGKANYGINTDIEGMVYASIEKCPVYKGKLKSFDDSEARKVKGVIDILEVTNVKAENASLHVQDGVAVIANSTWSAFKARKRLKIEWNFENRNSNSLSNLKETFTKNESEELEPRYMNGNLDAVKKLEGHEVYSASYDNPYEAHALMEPINATAHYKGDSCEVWVGTQSGQRATKAVSDVIGLPVEKVTTHVLNSGGSFGRRYYVDSSMEAAYLSKKLNKPVKLTWSREDEIAHDYFHPFQRSLHSAVISQDKKIVGWETKMLRTDDYASGAELYEIPYYFPNVKTSWKQIESIVHTGAWRSVSEHSSCLGRESFIDELAIKLGENPVDFRLGLLDKEIKLSDFKIADDLSGEALERQKAFAERIRFYRSLLQDRYVAILKSIKEKQWLDEPTSKNKGVGLAIESFGRTVCAHVVNITMDDRTVNGFTVDRVRGIVHCGTVVNPHFGTGQIEGSIIYALSALQYGGIEVEEGRVMRSNFHDNKLLRIDETPDIEVQFIPSNEAPSGLGEPGTPPLAPAVLNAIFNASGIRVRKIPVLKKDLVLKSAQVS